LNERQGSSGPVHGLAADISRQAPWVDRFRGWVVVGCLFFDWLIIFGGGFLTFSIFFDPLVHSFNWTYAQTSFLFTMVCLLFASASPPVGWLLEWSEARLALAASAVVAVVAYVIASEARGFLAMVTAHALIGIALALSWMPAPILVTEWFTDKRGLAMGVVMSGAPLGGMTMSKFVNHLIENFGWRAGYLGLAGLALLVLPMCLMLIRQAPVRLKRSHHEHEAASALEGIDLRRGLLSRTFWAFILSIFCYGFVTLLATAHLVPYLSNMGFQRQVAVTVYALINLAAFFGCFMLGALADRFGLRIVLYISLALVATSFLALLWVKNSGFLGFFIVAFGFNSIAPLALYLIVLAEIIGPRHYPFFSGIGNVSLTVGNALGPLVAGRIFDVTGKYRAAFVLSCIVTLLAGATIPRRRIGATDPIGGS
jgi:predicted MFS family arabinose efflux permease